MLIFWGLQEKVYQTGARNFLFFNVPPIERAPITLVLNEELQARKKAEVANWNNEVATIVHDFTKLHNDTTTFWWDANRSYNEVLDNPCLYPETCELRDLTTACPVCESDIQLQLGGNLKLMRLKMRRSWLLRLWRM